ncbi:phosphonate/organophosphate ester transporter subunit [compost metagenome]
MVCNLHQVDYAREFGDRIVGLAQGRMVYDGSVEGLNDAALQAIYHSPPVAATAPAPSPWQVAIPAGGLL